MQRVSLRNLDFLYRAIWQAGALHLHYQIHRVFSPRLENRDDLFQVVAVYRKRSQLTVEVANIYRNSAATFID